MAELQPLKMTFHIYTRYSNKNVLPSIVDPDQLEVFYLGYTQIGWNVGTPET